MCQFTLPTRREVIFVILPSDQLSITCIQWTNAPKFTPSPPWQIYYKSFTEGVFISSGLANWALPHEMCTPSVVDWTTM